MAVSSSYVAYVMDQLAQALPVTSRRMFGGVGVYCDGLFFGLIAADVFYLKVDDSNRADYLAQGCAAFQPRANDPDAYSMSYFAVPAEVLEDVDELKMWVRKSVGIAAAAAAGKSGRKKVAKKASARRRPAKR